jgi:two-component system, LuxR family, response regulator FixJ
MQNREAVHVIDADAAGRESLAFELEIENFEVHTYASANAFLAALSPEVHGCIVTDIRVPMPGMSGIGLLRRLKMLGVALPVIAVTTYGDHLLAAEAMNSGAIDCIMKPFNDDSLLSSIRTCISFPTTHFAIAELSDQRATA